MRSTLCRGPARSSPLLLPKEFVGPSCIVFAQARTWIRSVIDCLIAPVAITIVDERLQPEHDVFVSFSQRDGYVGQAFSQRHAVEFNATQLIRPANANEIGRAIIARDVGFGRGHDELTLANQVNLDQVHTSIEEFALLAFVRLAARASNLVCRVQHFDRRDDTATIACVNDFDMASVRGSSSSNKTQGSATSITAVS